MTTSVTGAGTRTHTHTIFVANKAIVLGQEGPFVNKQRAGHYGVNPNNENTPRLRVYGPAFDRQGVQVN